MARHIASADWTSGPANRRQREIRRATGEPTSSSTRKRSNLLGQRKDLVGEVEQLDVLFVLLLLAMGERLTSGLLPDGVAEPIPRRSRRGFTAPELRRGRGAGNLRRPGVPPHRRRSPPALGHGPRWRWQSTATSSAVDTSRMRSSLGRPRRSTRTRQTRATFIGQRGRLLSIPRGTNLSWDRFHQARARRARWRVRSAWPGSSSWAAACAG